MAVLPVMARLIDDRLVEANTRAYPDAVRRMKKLRLAALAVLTQIVVDVGETSGVELELSSSSARTHGGLSCLTLTPG